MKNTIKLNQTTTKPFSTLPALAAGAMLSAGLALATSGPAFGAQAKGGGAPLLLAENGKTSYVISLAGDAIPAEKTAARELSEYLQQISGATFTVKPEQEVGAEAPQILVGGGDRARKLLPGQKWEALGADGIVIKTVGRNLVLAGGRPRGALYAVYSFLEDQMGVRWWSPSETFVPAKRTVRIGKQDTTYTPQLLVREPYYSHLYSDDKNDALYAAHLKINGHHEWAQGPELGGHVFFAGDFVHTFGRLLPPQKYLKLHPEWFSDPDNGYKPCTVNSRVHGDQESQICLTNEELRKELTKNALEWLRTHPDATMISISQNDSGSKYIGGDDQKIEEEEGSPAGPLLRFVNAVAEDIEKEFPNVLVETMAYEYTRKPPLHVRPRHNVVIRLASDHADFSKGMSEDKGFHDLVEGWKAIAPRLYIWNYVGNHHNPIFPHPNFNRLGPDVRYAAANNAIALFDEGDRYSNFAGDFVALRVWLISHMMWNPAQDPKKLEDEFLSGYYGPAAPHLAAYLQTIQAAFLKTGWQLSMTQSMHAWLTLDAMNTATRQYRKAEAAVAGDQVLARRVRRERLALDHAWLMRYYPLQREYAKRRAAGEKVAFEGPKDLDAFAADFMRTGKEMDATKIAVDMNFGDYGPTLQKRLANYAAPLPAVCDGAKEIDVVDLQEDRFRLYQAGTLVNLADDTDASNKRTARMAGSSADWLVQSALNLQYPLEQTEHYFGDDLWHCYAVAKVVAKPGATDGRVLTAGIYDPKTKTTTVSLNKSLAEVGDGQYRVLDLGSHKLNPQMYFYATPPGREDIESVSIDRFLAVREPAGARN